MKKNHLGVWTILLALPSIGASNVPTEQPLRVTPLVVEKVITITNSQVDPAQLTIDRGDVVVWTFNDQPGTVVFTPGSYTSRPIPPGGRWSLYFVEPGTYEYRVFLKGNRISFIGQTVLAGRIMVR